MKIQLLKFTVLFLFGLSIGIVGTLLIYNPQNSEAKQVRKGGFALINPLLECEVGFTPQAELTHLKLALEDKIDELQAQGKVEEVALYFRDLNNGPTISLNGNAQFSPASLLKLPIMIAYYNEAERDPTFLQKKVKVETEEDMNKWESYTSKNFVIRGEEYSYEKLVTAMMVASDNNAMATLSMNMPLEIQDRVYKELGVTVPGLKGLNDFMTVKEYASFFRILYNASYLSEKYSEKALYLLTKTEFDYGIAGGVPENVIVANKFGERSLNGKNQLHDCGIVYLKDRPYLLCIMTHGDDLEVLAKAVTELSKLIYDDLSSE